MSALTLLPLDLTGVQLSNRIAGEQHHLITVPGKAHRLLVPRHGGFYAAHLQVALPGGQVLTRGVDYDITYLYTDLSQLTGQAVYGMVIITNPAVAASVLISYRAVGGQFGVDTEALRDVLDQLADDNQVLTWDDIIAKPREYPSADHTHEYWQVYGTETTVQSMNRVATAIGHERQAVYQHDIDYSLTYEGMARTTLDQLAAEIEAHLGRTDSPHQITAHQVGLGVVQNQPVASTTEAITGIVNNRYMTTQRTFEALTAQGILAAEAHYGDFNNPHQVTADQANAYTRAEIDTFIASKLDRTQPAYDSHLLEGRDLATVHAAIRANLPTSAFVEQVPPRRLGANIPTADTILLGDGTWTPVSEVFEAYTPPSQRTFYIGYIQNSATALNHIQTTYQNVTEYPVGSIGLFTMRREFKLGGTNGGMTYQVVLLDGCVRTASGWILMT